MAAPFSTSAASSQVEADEVAKLAKQISDHAEILYQTWRTQQQSSAPASPVSISTPSSSSSPAPTSPTSIAAALATAMQPPPGPPVTPPNIRYRNAPPSPPAATEQPNKRHSQYLRNAVNLLGSPGLEKQLEELVQNFIVEDKVRNAQRMKNSELATSSTPASVPVPRFQRRLPGGSPVLSAVEKYEKRQGISGSVRQQQQQQQQQVEEKKVTIVPVAVETNNSSIDEASNFLRQVEEDLINALKSGFVIDGSSKPQPPSSSTREAERRGILTSPSRQMSPGLASAASRLLPYPQNNGAMSTTMIAGDGYDSTSSVSPRLSPEPVQFRTSVGGSFTFPGESLVSPVDYAKVRYQQAREQDRLRVESVRTARALSPNSLTVVSETRSRFESGRDDHGSSRESSTEPWTLPAVHEGPSAEATVKMAEWFRRKAARKAAGNVPHPELTEQQRQHIKERCMSPTTYYNAAGVPIRPFLTRGSVAERVLIFEKCPTEVRDRAGAMGALSSSTSSLSHQHLHQHPSHRSSNGNLNTWRTNEVQSRAQTYTRADVGEAVVPSSHANLNNQQPAGGRNGQQQLASSNKRIELEIEDVENHHDHNRLIADELDCAASSSSGGKNHLSGVSKRLETSAIVPASHSNNHEPYHRHAHHHHHHHQTHPVAGMPVAAGPSSSTLRRQARAKPAQIPRFYYPMGRPRTSTELDKVSKKIADAFDVIGQSCLTRDDFSKVTKACDLPLYLKTPLFFCAVAQGCQVDAGKDGRITQNGSTPSSTSSDVAVGKKEFIDFWRRVLASHHDIYAQFVYVLSRGAPRAPKPFLLPEDFVAMVQDVVDSHPGLAFLREAQEFHFRYVRTVIARIYYCVNRSWSGRISLPELRRSNLIQVISMLETEDDINQITEYFSYEHFYVVYCKFWELDRDHDLFIDRVDLARHADGAISSRMIDRIFSGAVTRGQGHVASHRTAQGQVVRREEKHRMSYPEFIWFLISEEDKRHPTAIEYWFRCMDLDGDGFLSMYELEYFYEEQVQRLEAMGMEAMPFNDCLCQMLDMVQPAKPGMISLGDLKRCSQTPIFFDTFFNLEKYLEHEHRDPFAIQARDPENPEGQLSDWEKYCIEEYEHLVAEEGAGDAAEILYDDDMDDESADIDELSPNLDQLIDGSSGSHIVTEPDDDFADYADA